MSGDVLAELARVSDNHLPQLGGVDMSGSLRGDFWGDSWMVRTDLYLRTSRKDI